MIHNTLVTLVTGLIFSAAALANDALLTFEEMDRNSNGYITLNEAKASEDIAEHFKQIDSDGDGNINITEFQAYMGRDRMTPPEEMEVSEPGAAPY